jgi:hypothetical protein
LGKAEAEEGRMTDIPRGKYIGKRIGEPAADESEHFIKCETCGAWIDYRDLGAVLDHEGPHTATGRPRALSQKT